MLKYLSLFLLALPCLAASPDAAIRPTGLVLNETIALEAGAKLEVPLYLSRRGDYYAEIVLENAGPGGRPELVSFGADVEISRLDRVVLSRAVETELGRERPAATLFWFTIDREIPLKKPLTLSMQIKPDIQSAPGNSLRVQIKKRPQRIKWR